MHARRGRVALTPELVGLDEQLVAGQPTPSRMVR
jgi:hypothetical protein